MTKKRKIAFFVVLVVVVSAAVVFTNMGRSGAVTQEKEIAKIGNYTITESALKEYIILATGKTATADPKESLESIARDYAKAQIAAEEIKGTKYELSPEYRKELVALENEMSQANLEENSAYCEQRGITMEELTAATVTLKMDIAIKQRHSQVFYDKLKETEKRQGKEVKHTVEELVSLYEEYLEKKVAEMEFVILDAERVNNLQDFLENSFKKAEK